MKTIFILFSFFIASKFSLSALANDSFLGYAPDRGVIISVTPNKTSFKTGEKVKFNGSIKIANKNDNTKENEGDKNNKKSRNGLLEEFRKQGVDIVASFPSGAVDISSALTIQSVSESEITFSYESSAIQASEFNQFSLRIYDNHPESDRLKKLFKIKAKLDKRILALNSLLIEHRKKQSVQTTIEYIQKQIDKLATIDARITARLNVDENLMAENTYAVELRC